MYNEHMVVDNRGDFVGDLASSAQSYEDGTSYCIDW